MRRIRVLVADDSATARRAVEAALGSEPDLEVVGTAADGAQAVARARELRPDVVTMDVRMPILDGLEATAAIMASCPARILIVCALSEEEQQDLSFRAMEAGALEVIAKPGATQSFAEWARRLGESVRLMSEVPVVTRRRGADVHRSVPTRPGGIELVGIVASTGGPPALARILSALPVRFGAPLLVAQHITPGFASALARWLGTTTPLPVEVAAAGVRPAPGRIYVAPDGCDLEVDADGRLLTPQNTGGHCPSGDRLLHSIARHLGRRGAGVVLTGMGEDGAAGLRAVREAGGATFCQDEASSVVWGMPRAAWELGAGELVSVDQLPALLREIVTRRELLEPST